MTRKTFAAPGFSALQRAEIAETVNYVGDKQRNGFVSVLFNEPKLLKLAVVVVNACTGSRFSALQRAEIAETCVVRRLRHALRRFQCSSTSRNC